MTGAVHMRFHVLNSLRFKATLWQEEVRVHGDETELTQDDVDELNRDIADLLDAVKAVDAECSRLLAL